MKKIALVISGIVLLLFLFYVISGLFLSYNKPVESPYVLLEGWISYSIVDDAIEFINENNIDSVFVVGMRNSDASAGINEIDKSRKLEKTRNAYAVLWDGILGFEIPSERLKESFTLGVKMRGTSDKKHFPHYEIFVNEQFLGSGFVNEQDSIYEFSLSKNAADSLTYILINFDNDVLNATGDRNLYVSDIYIDSLDIDLLKTDNFFISSTVNSNFNYVSRLNSIKYYLGDLGYDTSRVKLVEVNYDPFNKTLALAKGAQEYFSKTEIKSINIITASRHSKRSYLNFKNCLGENSELGCIPVNMEIREKKSLYEGIDERVSLLLTWTYWWFH